MNIGPHWSGNYIVRFFIGKLGIGPETGEMEPGLVTNVGPHPTAKTMYIYVINLLCQNATIKKCTRLILYIGFI
jgi:hypothetical protein